MFSSSRKIGSTIFCLISLAVTVIQKVGIAEHLYEGIKCRIMPCHIKHNICTSDVCNEAFSVDFVKLDVVCSQ